MDSKHRWVSCGQVQASFSREVTWHWQELLMRLPSMRNTMSFFTWHGRSAGLACLLCFHLARRLTTFSSFLALAIVSAVGSQNQFGSQKHEPCLFPFASPLRHSNSLGNVDPVTLSGGENRYKEVRVQYFNVLSLCPEQLHIQNCIISQ